MSDEQAPPTESRPTDPDPEPDPPADETPFRLPATAWVVLAFLAAGALLVPLTMDRSVLIAEDFSGGLGPWGDAEDASASMGTEDGAYRMAVTGQGELQSVASLHGRYPAVRLELDSEMVDGNGGVSVLCMAETDLEAGSGIDHTQGGGGVYYDVFVFVAEDGYAILRSDDIERPLATATDRSGALTDGMNHVEVECVAPGPAGPGRVSLSVNGRSVLDSTDDGEMPPFDAVGLAVYSQGGAAVARFDNIRVSEI